MMMAVMKMKILIMEMEKTIRELLEMEEMLTDVQHLK